MGFERRTRGSVGGSNVGDGDDPCWTDPLLLVDMDEYRPGASFRVVGRLPAPLTVQLLRLPNGETVPVLERPDDYTGYVVRSAYGVEQVAATAIVFTRGALVPDGRYEFLDDALVFSERLRLFRSTARLLVEGGRRPEEPTSGRPPADRVTGGR